MTVQNEKRICGANKSRNRGICQATILYPNGRCKVHGGPSPSGIDSPHWKHGKYGGALPERLLAAYQAGKDDPELTGMREEIRLTDARLDELTRQIDQGGTAEQWALVQAAYDALQAVPAGDVKGWDAALVQLGDAIASHAGTEGTWKAIFDAQAHRRKLSESETRRMHRLHQMVSAERVTNMVGMLFESIVRHVQDQMVLRALRADFERYLTRMAGDG